MPIVPVLIRPNAHLPLFPFVLQWVHYALTTCINMFMLFCSVDLPASLLSHCSMENLLQDVCLSNTALAENVFVLNVYYNTVALVNFYVAIILNCFALI